MGWEGGGRGGTLSLIGVLKRQLSQEGRNGQNIYVYITEREPHRAELPRWKVSQQEGYFVG